MRRGPLQIRTDEKNRFYVNSFVVAGAATYTIPTVGFTLSTFDNLTGKPTLILQNLIYFAYYDLAASIGQFVSCPATMSISGLNSSSSTNFRNYTGSPVVANPIFCDRVFYDGLGILIGEPPFSNISLFGTILPNVAAAGLSSATLNYSVGFDIIR